jgi:NADH-quinone oxidoreductase subunit G
MPSTCKSPHEMFGALTKSYFASKEGIDPKNIVVVSLMPCLAKKYEADRPELNVDGLKDVDYVLTTREIARMIKESGINFDVLPSEPFDNPLGESSGAADIFGASGGVIEAALRTVVYWSEGKLEPVSFKELHGMNGVKTTEVKVLGTTLRIGVASGLGNARSLLEKIQNNEEHFDAIEIMACPGGCINGGGQPIHKRKMSNEILNKRIDGLNFEDRNKHLRISAKNESVLKLYREYLGEIGGEKSHHLLHTHYFPVK